jgi:asparagine synthase (glutamine-hydrolysing)
MCGFAGFLAGDRAPLGNDFHSCLERMGRAIAHRGPDDAGTWIDLEFGLGLVHRRLSILDLSQAGHQPMVSTSGRYVIAFNGEIYNHVDLRVELGEIGSVSTSASAWRGHSDTETLLAGVEHWGVEITLRKVVGMFAFVLWDRQLKKLILGRDRMGEKPLYYGWHGRVFFFGSELKALRAHPAFDGEICRDSVALFLRHNYIPAPYTIYRGIYKLTPGCYLEIQHGKLYDLPEPAPYWSLKGVVAEGQAAPFLGDEWDAVNTLEGLLQDSVRGQMMSDVPLGAFLSGGIDSSTIVAMMQTQSTRPIRTFTIGFNEAGFNEADRAKAVAGYLGTEHTELYVTPEHALAVIPNLPSLYDEPFSDSSQIPTFLVSEIARRSVTVSLSGDGGDELFAGYARYRRVLNLRRGFFKIPQDLWSIVAASIRMISVENWEKIFSPFKSFLPVRMSNVGDKLHKIAELNRMPDPMGFYRQFVSHWPLPDRLVLGSREPDIYLERTRWECSDLDYVGAMMLADSLTYLPDDILVKVDRAAMGVSLETRVPLLDHRIVEFAWKLPLSIKVRDGHSKWILRQILKKYMPVELIERPKMGFGVPIDAWLRGPLRDWAESLLDESRLKQEGFFNPAPIRQKWNQHLSGKSNWQYHLWDVLMFQAWLEHQGR